MPYECFYKEGLWRKYQNTDSTAYGGQDYKIDSDFIVGYIDVENKNIILNLKYNRQHNYDDYLRDTEIFRELKDMYNLKFIQANIAARQRNANSIYEVKTDDSSKSYQIDIYQILGCIEYILNFFTAIKSRFLNGISEEKYKELLSVVVDELNLIQYLLPQLKTNEQVDLTKEKQKRKNDSDLDLEQWDNISWNWNIEWE